MSIIIIGNLKYTFKLELLHLVQLKKCCCWSNKVIEALHNGEFFLFCHFQHINECVVFWQYGSGHILYKGLDKGRVSSIITDSWGIQRLKLLLLNCQQKKKKTTSQPRLTVMSENGWRCEVCLIGLDKSQKPIKQKPLCIPYDKLTREDLKTSFSLIQILVKENCVSQSYCTYWQGPGISPWREIPKHWNQHGIMRAI